MHDELTPEQETAQRINALQYEINRAEKLIAELKQPKEVKRWEPPLEYVDIIKIPYMGVEPTNISRKLSAFLETQKTLWLLAHEKNEGWVSTPEQPGSYILQSWDGEWIPVPRTYSSSTELRFKNEATAFEVCAMLNNGEVL